MPQKRFSLDCLELKMLQPYKAPKHTQEARLLNGSICYTQTHLTHSQSKVQMQKTLSALCSSFTLDHFHLGCLIHSPSKYMFSQYELIQRSCGLCIQQFGPLWSFLSLQWICEAIKDHVNWSLVASEGIFNSQCYRCRPQSKLCRAPGRSPWDDWEHGDTPSRSLAHLPVWKSEWNTLLSKKWRRKINRNEELFILN